MPWGKIKLVYNHNNNYYESFTLTIYTIIAIAIIQILYHPHESLSLLCLHAYYNIIMVFIAHKPQVADLEYLHCWYIHHHKCAPQSNQS